MQQWNCIVPSTCAQTLEHIHRFIWHQEMVQIGCYDSFYLWKSRLQSSTLMHSDAKAGYLRNGVWSTRRSSAHFGMVLSFDPPPVCEDPMYKQQHLQLWPVSCGCETALPVVSWQQKCEPTDVVRGRCPQLDPQPSLFWDARRRRPAAEKSIFGVVRNLLRNPWRINNYEHGARSTELQLSLLWTL